MNRVDEEMRNLIKHWCKNKITANEILATLETAKALVVAGISLDDDIFKKALNYFYSPTHNERCLNACIQTRDTFKNAGKS